MKILFICFALLMLVSCNSQLTRGQSFISDKWLVSYKAGVFCNVCPEVEFLDTNKGKVIFDSGNEVDFSYNLSTVGNKRKIVFAFEKKQTCFLVNEYFYETHIKGRLKKLVLSSSDGKIRYILNSHWF